MVRVYAILSILSLCLAIKLSSTGLAAEATAETFLKQQASLADIKVNLETI